MKFVTIITAVVLPLLLLLAIKPIDARDLSYVMHNDINKNSGEDFNVPIHQDLVENCNTPEIIENDDIPIQQDIVVVEEIAQSAEDSNDLSMFVDETSLDFVYWNSKFGNNKPIIIELGNEKQIINYWISNLPLKVITHGWLKSDENDEGVFSIKTGLDPASPGFEYASIISDHLNDTDAEFVDVIHTAIGIAGFSEPIGHADFYPNEGKSAQPGCLESYTLMEIIKLIHCNHSRSHEYYTESVYHRNSFMATECTSWDEYTNGECENNYKIYMGHNADTKARGTFYLKTNSIAPYGMSYITP